MREVRVRILLPEFVYQAGIGLLLLHRKIRYGYAFRKIPLTRGLFAIVDPERYDQLAKHKWHAISCHRGSYAKRTISVWVKGKKRRMGLMMHNVILPPPEGKVIDHININSLDNRIANLRIVTPQQNAWNRRKQRGNYSSRYKGVMWRKNNKKWRATIFMGDRNISLGNFYDEKAAARAYDAKARELYGRYAKTNF